MRASRHWSTPPRTSSGSRPSSSGGDVVLNGRVDVQLRGGPLAGGLERARRYAAAGADCVYPIAVTAEREIAAYVELGVPVNILALPDRPRAERLAALGVARISYGELIHAGVDEVARRASARDPGASSP